MTTPEDFPDYNESPFTPQVHQDRKVAGTSGMSQNAIATMRNKLIESIMQLITQAITGILTPFGLGSAFLQLTEWATDITDQLTDLVLQIPILGDLIEWLAGLFGVDLGDVGSHGVDFGDIWQNIVNIFINPLGFFANLIGGFIPNFQIPSFDASKIVSGFIGDGLLPIIGGIIGGITGFFGLGGSSDAAANAIAAQTAVLATISAAVARLEAQFADDDPDTTLAEDDFEYVGDPDPAKWDISYTSGDGGQTVDGHQLTWQKSGSLRNQATMRFIGTGGEATVDDMTTKIVLGSSIMPSTNGGNGRNALDVLARMNSTKTTFVRMRLYRDSFELHAVNSGVSTTMFSQSLVGPKGGPPGPPSPPPAGVGAIVTLQCGDATDHRNFLMTINDTSWSFFDSASVSQVGSSYRWRGMGQLAGQIVDTFFLTHQENAGPVAHWASQNAA